MSEKPGPPPNFWGDMPEEEYYASQGVKNHQERFKTPHATLFTQSWIPIEEGPVKGIVCMTHGYGSDTGWLFQKIAIAYAQWGYAVFGADLLGHGRSDGIRCYMGDMEKVAAASLHFFKAMRDSETYKGLPAFLFGESIGVAATLLMYFQDSDGWDNQDKEWSPVDDEIAIDQEIGNPSDAERSGESAGFWTLGGIVKTLTSKSEEVIESNCRDLEEFCSGLQKETEVIREVVSRAVKDFPNSLDVGTAYQWCACLSSDLWRQDRLSSLVLAWRKLIIIRGRMIGVQKKIIRRWKKLRHWRPQ